MGDRDCITRSGEGDLVVVAEAARCEVSGLPEAILRHGCIVLRRRFDPVTFLVLGLFLGVIVHAAQPDHEQRQEPNAAITTAKFDPALMATAIFDETNRVRQQLGLRPFARLAKLDEAAALKAGAGVLQSELTHTNPLPDTATPADRVRFVGLTYRLVAENIARLGLLNVPPGVTQIGIRRRGGREEPYLLDTGRAVAPHTYASFAARVVNDWMNSPAHRANIVNPELTSLGCAARTTLSWKGRQEQIYAVQVFFTPR